MNDISLNGAARLVYDSVLTPLSEGLSEVSQIKREDLYHRPPYVKLQTKNEEDGQTVKIYPYIIRHDSYLSSVYKIYAGVRNYTANSANSSGASGWLSDWSFGYIDPWNCNREKTAEALRTAVAAFRPFFDQIEIQLSQEDAKEELLDAVEEKITNIRQTVERAKKMIYYVYRTYDHGVGESEEKEELEDPGNGPECIYEQYKALSSLLDDLCSLEERMAKRRDLKSSCSEKSPARKPSSFQESNLQFSSKEAASAWFCRQRLYHQERIGRGSQVSLERLGKETYEDLMRTNHLSQRVPESFIRFAKTIDQQIAKFCRQDQIQSSQFVGDVYIRWLEKLKQEGELIPTSFRPDNFKMWFKELCSNGASQRTYQAVFFALINPENNGPYRLDCAPSALNAIMQSDYFSMFENCPSSLAISDKQGEAGI